MRQASKGAALLLLCGFALWAAREREEVCEHPDGEGPTQRVDARRVREAIEALGRFAPRTPFETPTPLRSSLPRCETAGKRAVSVRSLPARLVGRTFEFRSGEPVPEELAGLLHVRCVPCRVRILAETKLEVTEE